jgi:hypothetical protein
MEPLVSEWSRLLNKIFGPVLYIFPNAKLDHFIIKKIFFYDPFMYKTVKLSRPVRFCYQCPVIKSKFGRPVIENPGIDLIDFRLPDSSEYQDLTVNVC